MAAIVQRNTDNYRVPWRVFQGFRKNFGFSFPQDGRATKGDNERGGCRKGAERVAERGHPTFLSLGLEQGAGLMGWIIVTT